MTKRNVVKLAEEVEIDPKYDLTYGGIRQIIDAVNGSTSEAVMMAFDYGYRQGGLAQTATTEEEKRLLAAYRRLNDHAQEIMLATVEAAGESAHCSRKVTMIHREEED